MLHRITVFKPNPKVLYLILLAVKATLKVETLVF